MGKGFGNLTDSKFGGTNAVILGITITALSSDLTLDAGTYPITADFTRYGISDDGEQSNERFNDAIYRLELEETGDNTATFAGTLEYIMLNQIMSIKQVPTKQSHQSTAKL
jgi:hypothetical protein